MDRESSFDWQEHIHAGRKYLQTAQNGLKRANVFNNELIYHLTAMAVERLLVGLYQYHRQMPVDHTLDGLVDGMADFCPLEQDLAKSIKKMGHYDDMCPLVPAKPYKPDSMEIKAVLAVGRHVADFAELHIKPSVIQQAV